MSYELTMTEAVKVLAHRGKGKLIGVGGGSASGKSYFAQQLLSKIGHAVILKMDDYYKPRQFKSLDEYEKYNFDVPKAIDIELMREHLEKLLRGESINKPIYGYKGQRKGWERVNPASTIIVEGLFVISLVKSMHYVKSITVFVEAPLWLAAWRRIGRDSRGRDYGKAEVIRRWYRMVVPSYKKYIVKEKKLADIIVKNWWIGL